MTNKSRTSKKLSTKNGHSTRSELTCVVAFTETELACVENFVSVRLSKLHVEVGNKEAEELVDMLRKLLCARLTAQADAWKETHPAEFRSV